MVPNYLIKNSPKLPDKSGPKLPDKKWSQIT